MILNTKIDRYQRAISYYSPSSSVGDLRKVHAEHTRLEWTDLGFVEWLIEYHANSAFEKANDL